MADCVFCKIINKEIPANFVYNDEFVVAFLDINPLNRGHVLVVPKKHYENIFDIEAKILEKIIVIGQKLSQKAKGVLGAEGVNLLNASGGAAEQTVPHFHLHIVPRWEEDGLRMNDWWQSKTKKLSAEELEEIAGKLKS